MPDFRLNDVPGNPGLKSNFRNMGMELPASLPRQSVDDFLKKTGDAALYTALFL